MSGKGAHPFGSSWLESGNGERPSRLVENVLFPGRVDDLTEEELRAAREAGIAAFQERREPLYTQIRALLGDGTIHGTIHQTAQLDSALVNATAALYAATDPRTQLRWLQKFDPASPSIPDLQAALPAFLVLEQDYFNARAANSAVTALDAQKLAIEQSMQPDETIEAERDVRLAADELRRRGRPIGVQP